MTTTGTGTLKLISANGINLTGELGATSGDIQIGDHVDMNSSLIKELATPVSSTDAANKAYVDSTSASAVTGGANAGSFTTMTSTGNAIVGGNLTVNGTTTTINTAQVDIADNIITLNSDATGSATINAGIEVERGDDANVSIVWNETADNWTVAGNDFVADTFIGDLTGDVTGDVTGALTGNVTGHITGNTAGTHTGAVTGNVTGNVTGDLTGNSAGVHTGNVTGNVTGDLLGDVTGDVTGTTSSISNHLLDEDSMSSNSATKVASQQSIKAYVDAAILTEDNTDEIVEGSTNLYHTTARVDARTAVSTAANKLVWEAYADQAEADAESAAASDATTKADAAQAAAIASAEAKDVARMVTSDAYADASEAAAISTAASTAESKDVARMVTSDAYADASEAAAIASAEAKDVARMVTSDAYADASETAAIAAAESKDVSRASTAVSNIATAKAEAIASASTDATNKADAAEADAITSAESKDAVRATAANTYADAAVAALVDSAPASLNTLNELAAAIADDASYSSTLTTLVGTKLALAGGTMSGDIAMGGNDITGGGDATFTNFNGTATYALYADLAERYAADAPYEEGTVVSFGGEAEVTSAQGYGSTKIAGVVSTNPGFAMNSEAGNSETHPYIALQGRVPCKVMGTVSKGDILVASEVSGIATAWLESSVDPRMTSYVGIAIEDKTTDAVGYIEVKVGK
jgi:hypothetical protein